MATFQVNLDNPVVPLDFTSPFVAVMSMLSGQTSAPSNLHHCIAFDPIIVYVPHVQTTLINPS